MEKVMKHSVLVAEDDGVVLATLSAGLRQVGYEVREAKGGDSAYAAVGEWRPDVALLDIRMPGMDGVELAQRLHDEYAIPVVFLTAYGDSDLVDSAIDTGAFGYLVKPVEVTRLPPLLETAISRGRELAGIKSAIDKNRQINAAVGVLMERYHISMLRAFEALRTVARRERKKLEVIATNVVSSTEQTNLFHDEFCSNGRSPRG